VDSVVTQAPVLWAGVREALRRRLGEAKFDAWIARLEFIAEVNGEILLAASDDYQRSRVDTDFGHIIQQAWDQVDDEGRTVRIEARERIAPDVLALAQPRSCC
jgi:chromosomal replication initiation ATPase DnaA